MVKLMLEFLFEITLSFIDYTYLLYFYLIFIGSKWNFKKIDESTIKALSTIDPVLTHFDSSNHVLSILNFDNNEPTLYEFYLSTKETKTKSFEKSDETLDLVPYHFVRKKVDTTQF